MHTFLDWILSRHAATFLRLLEAAEVFNPQTYNQVFQDELEKLLARINDSEAREQVLGMAGFDWAEYLSRSLRRAGFRDDEHFHSIVVKLLVSPGNLFRGWEPQRHGPLDRRFQRSVWNAIRNIAEKTRNRHRWMQAVDPLAMASMSAKKQSQSDLIDEFRRLVVQSLGTLALSILDQRLAGEDTKDLVSNGMASAFSIKQEVKAIKDLARQFAARLGDPAFSNMVDHAFDAEAATVAKRRQALAASRAS